MLDKKLNPIIQFKEWFEEAKNKEINDPNAMCLSTVSENGKPHSRMVLLKDFNNNGFIFYSNYESNKASDINVNSNVCLNFHWKSLLKQIRIEGVIKKLPSDVSDKYFNSRHYLSRIGAWASDQSRILESREILENRIDQYKKKYPNENKVPRPPHWGGYIVNYNRIEFWEDMPHRIHKRDVFELVNKNWKQFSLSP